jgi:hypothetical protein
MFDTSDNEPVTVRVPTGDDAPPTVRFSGQAYHEILERQLYEDIVDENW